MKYSTHQTRLPLSTTALSSCGEEIKLFALLEEKDNEFSVSLQNEKSDELGSMKLRLKDKGVYIDYMKSNSKNKHIGYALHEFAFKFSIEMAREGHVDLNAAYNSHYFHHKCGFKPIGAGMEYYFLLAKAVTLAQGKHVNSSDLMSSYPLYLTDHAIEVNKQKFKLYQTSNESKIENLSSHSKMDSLIAEAEANSFAIKVLLGLNEGIARQIRDEIESSVTKFDIDELWVIQKREAALYCRHTKMSIDTACSELLNFLPLDTEEKNRTWDLVIIGLMIFTMAFQDKKYGAQKCYNNLLLYPHKSLDDLFKLIGHSREKPLKPFDLFTRLGEAALVDYSIPFDGVHKELFYSLSNIPEFTSRLAKYIIPEQSIVTDTAEKLIVKINLFTQPEKESGARPQQQVQRLQMLSS